MPGKAGAFQKLAGKKFPVAASVLLAAVVADMLIGSFYDVVREELTYSGLGVLIFLALVAVIYGLGQYILLGFVKRASKSLRTKSVPFNALYAATVTIQFGITAILLIMVAQMTTGSHYDLRLIVAGTALSTVTAAVLLGWFSYRFLLWYRSNRKHAMVLLLGLAEAASALAAAGNVISMTSMLSEGQMEIGPQTSLNYHEFAEGLRVPFFLTIVFPTVLSFILRWGGIVLVIRNFSKKIGRAQFWVFVCVPLVVLMGGIFTVLLDPFASHLTLYEPEMLQSRIVGQIGAGISFVLMGLAYYAIARNIRRIDPRSVVIGYMLVAAYGVIILPYSLSSPVIIYVAYPPFGSAAHFFLLTGSYLMSLGLYSSALSVSQDMNLRQSIRKQAIEEARLLESIGMANMEEELQKRVARIAKNSSDAMAQETGIQPSITEQDLNQYLEYVMKEINARKTANADA